MEKKILYILRALPGAGKSTVAKTLTREELICEADQYFYDENGFYNWRVEDLGAAHRWCQNKCAQLLNEGASPVVVSNTNTTEKELNTYLEMGKKFGYTVFSLIVENRHEGKNVHNVPDEALEKMRNRFEIKL